MSHICTIEHRDAQVPEYRLSNSHSPKRRWTGWNVYFQGERILEDVRDPEHEACRALLAMGKSGRVMFTHLERGTIGMTMDIASGAGLSTRDEFLRFASYKPFAASSLASQQAEAE